MDGQMKPKKKIGCLGIIGIVIGAILVIGILAAIFGGNNGGTSNNPTTVSDNTKNSAKNTSKPNVTEPKETKPKIEFTNVISQSQMGITSVIGEAINNDSKAHSFTLKVSFYDKDKKLLGSAVGAVNDLNGGEKKIFNAMATGDYSKADSYKVEVDTLVSSTSNTKSPIEFSNIVLKSQMGITTVDGEAKNTDTTDHSFTLVVAFYDKNKKLIGSATGAVNDLVGGSTKTFTAMATGEYSKADSYIVQVDTLVK
jgi:hypothetical protein